MQRSDHSFEAVAHSPHAKQYVEAVYYPRAGLKDDGDQGRKGGGEMGESGGEIVADLRLG